MCNRLTPSSVVSINLSNWQWKTSLEMRNQPTKRGWFGTASTGEEFPFNYLTCNVIFEAADPDLLDKQCYLFKQVKGCE